MMQHILLATDYSSCAQEALKQAVDLAKALKAKITLLNVFETFFPAPPLPSAADPPGVYQWLENVKNEERRKLRVAAETAEREGVEVAVLFKEGNPSAEIVRCAQEIKADLIVLGTHGRKGLSHALIGSVAERVARHAPCPVLIVREKSEQKHSKNDKEETASKRTGRKR
jgi:nucleotide-binding universal stress UspA family protein